MLDRLALKINEEAQRKKKLKKDIDEIRSNISICQASMAAQGLWRKLTVFKTHMCMLKWMKTN